MALDDKIRGLGGGASVWERISENTVKSLFDSRNLLMLGRVTREGLGEIVRMLIITDFYSRYYESCKVSYSLVKTDIPPYVRVSAVEIRPDKDKVMSSTIKNLMENILKLGVSLDGRGRDEAVSIVQNANCMVSSDNTGGIAGLLKGR